MDKAYEDDLEGIDRCFRAWCGRDSSLPGRLNITRTWPYLGHEPMTYDSQTIAISKALP